MSGRGGKTSSAQRSKTENYSARFPVYAGVFNREWICFSSESKSIFFPKQPLSLWKVWVKARQHQQLPLEDGFFF